MLKNILGIDIGSYAIKIVELTNPSKPKLNRYAVIPVPKFKEETDPIEEISKLILNYLREEGVRTRNVSTALLGTTGLIRFMTFPKLPKEEIKSLILGEPDRYFLGTDINSLNIDVDIIGEIKEAGEIRVESIIVAAMKDVIQRRMEILLKARLVPNVIDLEQTSLVNMYEFNYHNPERPKTVLIANIGAERTSLCIIEHGIPRVIREFAIGGNMFTQDIAKVLNVDYTQAEEMKLKYGLSLPCERKTEWVTLTSVEEFVREIQKSIDFYYSTRGEYFAINEILLSGGGSLLNGLKDYIQKSLGIPTSIVDPFIKVEKDEEIPPVISPLFSVAIGVALRF